MTNASKHLAPDNLSPTTSVNEQHANYLRVEKAIRFLNEHQQRQPKLAELAKFVGVSEFHLQRVFSEWAGVSPKQFLQYLTKEKAKQRLRSSSVLEASYACGLSGSSRLHDLMIRCESVTPGEYKNWGDGLEISYGIHSSLFGYCFIAITHRGVCKLAFIDELEAYSGLIAELELDWPDALISENQTSTQSVANQIFSSKGCEKDSFNVLLKGSPFQIKVWEALLTIPEGNLLSYQQLAERIGHASSVRAVASAVARNKVGYLIPCHRVIRSTGALSQYRWGSHRKAAIIAWEGSLS